MIDFIINLLTPVFVKMGASAADVGNYIRSVSASTPFWPRCW